MGRIAWPQQVEDQGDAILKGKSRICGVGPEQAAEKKDGFPPNQQGEMEQNRFRSAADHANPRT